MVFFFAAFYLFFMNVAIPFSYYRYTAVGVFVLGRMFREAWGSQASKKQAEFNEFLEVNLELELC